MYTYWRIGKRALHWLAQDHNKSVLNRTLHCVDFLRESTLSAFTPDMFFVIFL